MNNCGSNNTNIQSKFSTYINLKHQESFLNYGVIIVSCYNDRKLHNCIKMLDEIKENLLKNPENRILKLKFQVKLKHLKSIIYTQKRLEMLNVDIKNLNTR